MVLRLEAALFVPGVRKHAACFPHIVVRDRRSVRLESRVLWLLPAAWIPLGDGALPRRSSTKGIKDPRRADAASASDGRVATGIGWIAG